MMKMKTIPGIAGPEFFERRIASYGKARHVRDQVLGSAEYALSENHLRGAAHNILETYRDEFIKQFDETKGDWTDASQAIDLALRIGTFVGAVRVASIGLEQWRSELTAEARKVRRAEPIQAIIDAAAREYWERKPGKRGKASETARAILPAVKAKLSEARDVPKQWRKGDDKALIERIRKRLARLAQKDN